MFGKPVKSLIERIKDIAEGEGDLTQRIEVNPTTSSASSATGSTPSSSGSTT